MSKANERQVGGGHYGGGKHQHWDIVVEHELNYFEAQILRYVMRCRKKQGLEDLEKAKHFIEKYIEVWHKMQELPTEVIRYMPHDREKEWEDQLAAQKMFQPDGFSGDGSTGYQCIHCRAVIKAYSPLQALERHLCHLAPTHQTLGPSEGV